MADDEDEIDLNINLIKKNRKEEKNKCKNLKFCILWFFIIIVFFVIVFIYNFFLIKKKNFINFVEMNIFFAILLITIQIVIKIIIGQFTIMKLHVFVS